MNKIYAKLLCCIGIIMMFCATHPAAPTQKLSKSFVGLGESEPTQIFYQRLHVLANILLIQEAAIQEILDTQKLYMTYRAAERAAFLYQPTLIKIVRSRIIFAPIFNPPIESIEGLMALIDSHNAFETCQVRPEDRLLAQKLQASKNEECQRIGAMLGKNIDTQDAGGATYKKNSKTMFLLYRFRWEDIKVLEGAPVWHLIEPYIRYFRFFENKNKLMTEATKSEQHIKEEVTRIRETEKNFYTEEATRLHQLYQHIRQSCHQLYAEIYSMLLHKGRKDLRHKQIVKTTIVNSQGIEEELSGAEQYAVLSQSPSLPAKIDVIHCDDLPIYGYQRRPNGGIRVKDLKALCHYKDDEEDNLDESEEAALHNEIKLFEKDIRGALAKPAEPSSSIADFDTLRRFLRMSLSIPDESISTASTAPKPMPEQHTSALSSVTPQLSKQETATPKKKKKKKQPKGVISTPAPAACLSAPTPEPAAAALAPDVSPSTPAPAACLSIPESATAAPAPGAELDAMAAHFDFLFQEKRKKKRVEIGDTPQSSLPLACTKQPIAEDSVRAISPRHFAIRDNRNDVELHVYLPSHENHLRKLGFSYSIAIDRWFSNPERALYLKSYTNPKSLDFIQHCYEDLPIQNTKSIRHITFIHNFSRLMDQYMLSHGIIQQQMVGNRNTLYTPLVLPGHIVYAEGQEKSCLFVYFLNDVDSCRCFHRNIQITPRTELSNQYQRNGSFDVSASFDDDDFTDQ